MTVLVAVGAVLLAIVVAAVAAAIAIVATRRKSASADERVAEVVSSLNARMDELARELAGAVERAEDESRRSRFLGDLAGSIDLDDVLERTLEAASGIQGADASLVSLSGGEGPPHVATLGLSQAEAEHHALGGPPDGRRARSVSLTYRYAPEELTTNGELIHSGLAVPFPADLDEVGHLAIFSRSAAKGFGDAEVESLEELALRAGPAIENARRFREARQLADLDALTGLHNRRFFHETLARECARAHRYNRRLGLIVFDLDDFKNVNDKVGHLAGDAVLAEAAERVREVIRTADIPCRVGGDEFAVILPEAGIEQAEQLFGRLQGTISGRPIGQAGRLHISAGVAELKPDDDSISFFERSDEALYRAKEAGKGQSVTADGRATA